jgi:hypothetical protein
MENGEHLERRFGIIAVEKGFIGIEHLLEALSIQVMEDKEKGRHRLVGTILLELGLMTAVQIDEVLETVYPSPIK